MPKGQKTLPVSAKTLPVASVNVASTTPTSPLVSGSTPRQVSAPSLVTPVKVSRASLLVRAASFGRMRRPAPVAEASTVPAILDRLQSSGGGGSSPIGAAAAKNQSFFALSAAGGEKIFRPGPKKGGNWTSLTLEPRTGRLSEPQNREPAVLGPREPRTERTENQRRGPKILDGRRAARARSRRCS